MGFVSINEHSGERGESSIKPEHDEKAVCGFGWESEPY